MDLALADKSGGVRGAVEKDIERAGEQQERGESLVPPRRAAKHTHRRRPRLGALRTAWGRRRRGSGGRWRGATHTHPTHKHARCSGRAQP